MVKTPRRRKKKENGDAPETPQEEETLLSPPASRLRSRPKRRREHDDEEDSVTTNDEEGEMTRKPAAKRRSTRVRKKSRGASDEDSIATTDEEDEQQQQRPAKKRKTSTKRASGRKKTATKSSDDDESMTEESVMASEDDDDDVSMEDAKPTAKQNGYKPASLPTVPEEDNTRTTTTNGTKALAPISKLRMPSKHTPGKLQTTAPAPGRTDESRRLEFGAPNRVLTQVPPTAASGGTTTSQQQQQEESPPGVDNVQLNEILVQGNQRKEEERPPPQVQQQQQVSLSWFQVATTSLKTVVYSIGDLATSLVVPQVEHYAEGEEEDIEVPVSSPLLTRPFVWFLILLFLQVACWNPVVTTVKDTSDRSLDFYKSILGTKKKMSAMEETKETTVMMDTVNEETQKDLQALSQVLESFRKGSTINDEMQFAQRKLLEIRGRMRERQQALDDWQSGLKDVESALNGLATAESMDHVPHLFFRANEILGFFKDMVPPTLSTDILDTTYVFLWETATLTDCTAPSDDPTNHDPLMTLDKLHMVEEELRQMTQSSASKIQSDEQVLKSLQSWVQEALPESVTSPSRETNTPTKGVTQDMAQNIIAELLEKQQADQLGVVDYASISSGALVIERATSPSLIDSLPLFNRLMENARLRFYGYGPEAALTPTFPVNALGQCWAFASDSGRMGGRYATLTVQLRKPIYVTNVAIEHAARELTDQLESAIRSFRILGYKDGDAMEDPWQLGSFTYDIDAPRTLQIFQVANHVDGELIPKLRSVSLAIDSNWGFSYSCLYRFRVLGGDEPSESIVEAMFEGDDYVSDSDIAEDYFEEEIIDGDIYEEIVDDDDDDDEGDIDYEGHLETASEDAEEGHGADSTLEDQHEEDTVIADEESQGEAESTSTEEQHEEMNGGSDQSEAHDEETDEEGSDQHFERDGDIEEEEIHRWDAGEDEGDDDDRHEDDDSGDEDRYEDDSGDDSEDGDSSDDADDDSHHDDMSDEEERHRDYPRHHHAQQSA